MDSIVDAALEEICLAVDGLTIRDLWPKLHSSLSSIGLQNSCTNVRKALWTNLLNTHGLQFKLKDVFYNPQDPTIQSLEESEAISLKIVANKHLRNSFFGIYDIKITDTERRVLERLAKARTNGVAQSELAKEFDMKSKNMFHVVRNLECRGLIVRQSTIIRKDDACIGGEPKKVSVVTTNMLQLHRYAKHLGREQRLEVTKYGKTIIDNGSADANAVTWDSLSKECAIEDVHIKDNIPAMRTICDKLEKAHGQFLVVSDIKRDLGYQGTSGHRAWRRVNPAIP